MPHGSVNDPRVFISIANDGTVSIVCHRWIWTGRAHRHAANRGRRNGSRRARENCSSLGDEVTYGNQDTDGSRSTRHFMLPMCQCGAAARMMLAGAAAKRWNGALTDVEAKPRGRQQEDRGKARLWRIERRAAGMAVPAVS
jgi:isoquinoline 1-oxidoreductase beta subunit